MRLVLICIFFIAIGCAQDTDDFALYNNETNIDLVNNQSEYDDLIARRAEDISDNFVIDTAYILGEWLNLKVSYGGGCENHTFKAYWSGVLEYSNPPQTYVLLTHQSNNDFCEAYITQDLSINLTWLLNGNLDESGIIVIVQNGANEQNYTAE
ncbi:MAG: hypothetical protein KAI79_05415 [Bacteroidales bacterium]|nr:hypothetical protein [Bacteroidales bacterium]